MFSLLSSYNQTRLQSKLYKAQAATLQANAKGTRNRARSQAAAIQHAAQQNQRLAAEQLMDAQAQQALAESKVRTQQAYSGFDNDKGTGGQNLTNLQQQFDAQIANMELQASIAMFNSWQQAIDTQRQGELDALTQESTASQYAAAAKSARTSATLGLIAGGINAYKGYQQGEQSALTHNENMQNLFNKGLITDKQLKAYSVDPEQYGYNAAAAAGYQGFHFVNSFNPYVGALSADANNRKNNWGGFLSVLSGNVPYKIPASGTIFAQY